MSEAKHVHVIGIGGSAMAPLAGMLRESGYRVTGSDSGVYPPASTLLDSLGIAFNNAFDAAHMEPAPDLVVVETLLPEGTRSWKRCWTARFRIARCRRFWRKCFAGAAFYRGERDAWKDYDDGDAGMDLS